METDCAGTVLNESRSLAPAARKRLLHSNKEARNQCEVLEDLSKNLVNAVDLKVRAAHAAWRAWTNNNSRLSVAYAEFGGDLDNLADDIGFRMTTLGGQPYGLVLRLDGATRLPAETTATQSDSEHVSAMRASIAAALTDVTEAINKMPDPDFDTDDILQRYQQRLASMERYLADFDQPST